MPQEFYAGLKRRRRKRAAVLLMTMLSACKPAPFDGTVWSNPGTKFAEMAHETFHSAAMNVDIGYNIYLPPGYAEHAQWRYPVVYFLHGKYGDETAEPPQFEERLAKGPGPAAIFVFPNGGKNSKYIDAAPGSPMDGVIMVETAIGRELVAHIDQRYRTIPERSGRFIQGFSMGGLGALRLAFTFPDTFSAVYAFSPAVDDDVDNIAENEPDLLKQALNNDPQNWKARMIGSVARANASRIIGRMRVEMSIGEDDDLLPYVRALSSELNDAGVRNVLTTTPGLGHAYAFGANLLQIPSPNAGMR